MIGAPHRGHMHRPKYYEESCSSGSEGLSRDRQRMLAEFLRQRQGGMFDGHRPALGGMGGHPPPFLGGHGMGPMMGGYPRHGFHPQMRMGPGMGMPMGLGMGMAPGIGMGMGFGMGMGPGRHPFSHAPFGGQRHSPFGYGGPGPPRAHSFLPQHRHGHSPFSRSRHSPFSSRMFDDEDDFDGDYRMPSRYGPVRRMRGGYRFASRHPSRRRGFRPGLFEDSEDEYDEYDDWDHDFEDEDEYEGYFQRRSPQMWWRGGY